MPKTKIDLSQKYVIIVNDPEETNSPTLVSFTGGDDYTTTNKDTALKHAAEMKETFPKADYKVYQLIEVK